MAERSGDHEIESRGHQQNLEHDRQYDPTSGEKSDARPNADRTDQYPTDSLDRRDVHRRSPMRRVRR
jgi:hypothetical protein